MALRCITLSNQHIKRQENITEEYLKVPLIQWWSSSIQSLVLTSVCDMIISSDFFLVVFESYSVVSALAPSGADGVFFVCFSIPFGICFPVCVLTLSLRSFSNWFVHWSSYMFCLVSAAEKRCERPWETHEANKAPGKLSDVRIFLLSVPIFLD